MQEKISLFDTPSTCFMAKAAKVQSNDEGDHDDDASDHDSDSDDDNGPTKNELYIMLEDCKNAYKTTRKECKEVLKE